MANRALCLAQQPAQPVYGRPVCPSCFDRMYRHGADETCDYDPINGDVPPVPIADAIDRAQIELEIAAQRDVTRRGTI